MTRSGIAWVWARRRLRIALLAVIVVVSLGGGSWLLLRHSSLTTVEHVRVNGLIAVHGADTAAIETALTGAAHGMSTLAVNPAALRAAVASYPIVRSVNARASFPHGLRIEVVERPPVAALVIGGVRTAVAADGVVLGAGFLSGALPLVNPGRAATAATTALPVVGGSVRGAPLLGALAVLGAAPTPLARTLTRVYSGPEGLTVALRGGLLAYFGDATRAHAKWFSLARVLADSNSAGAAYIDVRLPERPAAGFAPGTAPPGASATETESTGASNPNTAAELAGGLNAAVGGGAGSSAASGASTGSGAGVESGAGSEAGQGASSTSSEAGSTGSTAGEVGSAASSSEGESAEASETPTTSGVPGG